MRGDFFPNEMYIDIHCFVIRLRSFHFRIWSETGVIFPNVHGYKWIINQFEFILF